MLRGCGSVARPVEGRSLPKLSTADTVDEVVAGADDRVAHIEWPLLSHRRASRRKTPAGSSLLRCPSLLCGSLVCRADGRRCDKLAHQRVSIHGGFADGLRCARQDSLLSQTVRNGWVGASGGRPSHSYWTNVVGPQHRGHPASRQGRARPCLSSCLQLRQAHLYCLHSLQQLRGTVHVSSVAQLCRLKRPEQHRELSDNLSIRQSQNLPIRCLPIRLTYGKLTSVYQFAMSHISYLISTTADLTRAS